MTHWAMLIGWMPTCAGVTTIGDPMAPLYRSKLLSTIPGVVHGFTTRHGGASRGSFASLNVARGVGDEDSAVDTNRLIVARSLGRPEAHWWALNQVHGSMVVQAGSSSTPLDADAHWSADPSGLLTIKVADCVPVLFATKDGSVVAAAHAGWRGTEARIVAAVVRVFQIQGIPPTDLLVALGPAIGPEAFEIGPEVLAALEHAFPGAPNPISGAERTVRATRIFGPSIAGLSWRRGSLVRR